MAQLKKNYKKRNASKPFALLLIVTGLGLVFLVAWALLNGRSQNKAAIEVTGSAKIKVDQQAFDYGDVKLGGTPIRTVVRVTNVGDQDLKFKEAPYIEVLEGC